MELLLAGRCGAGEARHTGNVGSIPWFWGINGAAGVLASISAIAVSLALGIKATLIVGALCYFLLIPVSLALVQQSKPLKFSKKQAR
jgi:hypothetical protein